MPVLAPVIDDLVHERRPSRARSFFAAVVVGATAATLTYRLLRRAPDASADEVAT